MNHGKIINGNDGEAGAGWPGAAPWLSALLAGALMLPGGCVEDAEPPGGSEAPSWSAFLAASTSYFEGRAIYMIDGDIAVSLEELRAEYERLSGPQAGLGVEGQASTVNTVGGADDLWSAGAAQSLTYCVSNDFGGRKSRAVSEMAHAAEGWQAHAGVHFQYVATEDGNCVGGNPNVVFAVAPWSGNGACAFYPSGGGCVPRTVVINYDFNFGAPTTLGIFRHELGHVLGLRHEHIRVPGTWCTEGGTWRGVTEYDSASVMHDPGCPGGTNTGDLNITELDAAGIRALYPPQPFQRVLTAWEQPEPGWTGYTLHVADVSGDGRADLVWSWLGATNRTYVALADGDGTFTRALTAWDQPEGGWTGYTLHVADVSGDGRADLVWNGLSATTNRTYVALADGDGTFTRALSGWNQPEAGWSDFTLHVADVSGDGRADLIWSAIGAKNRTYVALASGNGTFTRALTAWDQPESDWYGYTLRVADVSGDGRADLIWSWLDARNRTYVALANGDGTFTRALAAWEQPEYGWYGYTFHIADVSGDGRGDLIWSWLGVQNRTYVALADGDGTFTRALTAWNQPEYGWDGYTLHVADVSGDGRADLIWSWLGATNRTYVAVADGDGTFTRALTAWDQPEAGWDGYSLHVADITGDGRSDLVWNQRLTTTNRTYTAISTL